MEGQDPDLGLRNNVRLLGSALGEIIQQQAGMDLFDHVEQIRQISKEIDQGDLQAGKKLHRYFKKLNPQEIRLVVRAFSHFLNLSNIAENYHRIRRTRWHQRQVPYTYQKGSMAWVLKKLKKENIDQNKIQEVLENLSIDIVFTAHPTEVTRRTLIHKYEDIARCLDTLEHPDLTPHEIQSYHDKLKRLITECWQTDEIRRKRPTPLDEAKWGLAVVEGSIFEAIPRYMREFDKQYQELTGIALPLSTMPIKIGSWMGGDRDGNPHVTHQITEEVCWLSMWKAMDLYEQAVHRLGASLSMASCNDALKARVGEADEPYRAILKQLHQRLQQTKSWLKRRIDGQNDLVEDLIDNKQQILEPLHLCYQSLMDTNAPSIANGPLLDLIRQVTCFGISVLTLDIRQDASKHAALMNEVTEYLNLGEYQTWTEDQKQTFLLEELAKKRPLIPEGINFSSESFEVWQSFKILGNQIRDTLGAYVVSMSKAASDVLLVYLLQREAGVKNPLRVVPLFETLKDLNHAEKIMDTLYDIPLYLNKIQGAQEVMIGYSDSAKDAGIIAANWAIYRAQEALVALSQKRGIHLTLFHGRGGTVSRGGAPAHWAILSQPPGAINKGLRVTEQGEVIRNKYGMLRNACRTLELYTSATMEATLIPPPSPNAQWRRIIDDFAQKSCLSYRELAQNNQSFVDYFYQVTPVEEIGQLMIGSRPAKRGRERESGIKDLRAIPWVFAWTQSRLTLPAWLGVGQGLNAIIKEYGDEVYDIFESWPFFNSLVSMVEMVLAKTDINIFAFYESQLLKNNEDISKEVKEHFEKTVQAVKRVIKTEQLLNSNLGLKRSIQVRSPYIYPLNMMQAELLKRTRAQDNEQIDDDIFDALLISISGIAAGMRNTG